MSRDLNEDGNEPGFEQLKDQEIEARGTSEEEAETNEHAKLIHEMALQYVTRLLQYLEDQDNDQHLTEKLMLRKVKSRIKKLFSHQETKTNI